MPALTAVDVNQGIACKMTITLGITLLAATMHGAAEHQHSACCCHRQGFSLLMYGFGSKRQLLNSFATSTLSSAGVLSVTGQCSSLTAKQIVIKVASMLQRGSPAELK